MTFEITELLKAVVLLSTAFITAILIPWIRSKTDNEGFAELLGWVEIAVAAAEQIYKANDGEIKKLYVLEFLSSKGFMVDTAEIENAIEAAVLKLHTELYGVNYEGSEEQNKRCGFADC